ncbi:MAG: hypothetical protein WBA41_28105 [Rivularia sp. (in: cyanobacteria)]
MSNIIFKKTKREPDAEGATIHEPIDLRKAVTYYKVMFYAFFGYWLSYHTEMSMMFRQI